MRSATDDSCADGRSDGGCAGTRGSNSVAVVLQPTQMSTSRMPHAAFELGRVTAAKVAIAFAQNGRLLEDGGRLLSSPAERCPSG